MKMLALTAVAFPILLVSCNLDPNGIKAHKEWLAQKQKERLEYNKQVEEDQINGLKKQTEKKKQFEASHPEVAIEKVDVGSVPATEKKFASIINGLGFVTRHPGEQTPDNVYAKVGTYNLTIRRFQMAVESYADECKRISAYNNADYKSVCVDNLADALNDFSSMLKNKNIPDKTKTAALYEATDGHYIDFEHAAKLASMHAKLCYQQHNQGYVAMVTVAAPCNGIGDVLSISTARSIGVI